MKANSEVNLHDALFFREPLLDRERLRDYARECNEKSPLIKAVGSGDLYFAQALMKGFYYFVREFERTIDIRSQRLPWKSLFTRFGAATAKERIRAIKNGVAGMMAEEGQHKALWVRDANRLGLSEADLPFSSTLLVLALINIVERAVHPWQFMARLAATEYIAEELSRYLVNQPAYLALFKDGIPIWWWGAAHLSLDHNGPSHLEIDEDLARAFHPLQSGDEKSETPKLRQCIRLEIEETITSYCTVFADASREVYEEAVRERQRKFSSV